MINLSHLKVTYRIRNADHISYVLPDGKHTVDIFFHEKWVYCYVLVERSTARVLSFPICKTKVKQWEDLVHQFCELAHKKFAKDMMQRGDTP